MWYFPDRKTKIIHGISIGVIGLDALFMAACGSSNSVAPSGIHGEVTSVSTPIAVPGIEYHDMGSYYTLNDNKLADYIYYLNYVVNNAGSDPEKVATAYAHGLCDYSIAISKLSNADQYKFNEATSETRDRISSRSIETSDYVASHIAEAKIGGEKGLTYICFAK